MSESEPTAFRRIIGVGFAVMAVLSAIGQIERLVGGGSLWRLLIITANADAALILLRAVWLERPLTWRFLIFPQFGEWR